MAWEHKKVTICLEEETGLFAFFNQEKKEVEKVESLKEAKRRIDEIQKGYYNFTFDDIKALLNKLDDREKDFVLDLIEELELHDENCYCGMGIHNTLHFNFNFTEFMDSCAQDWITKQINK